MPGKYEEINYLKYFFLLFRHLGGHNLEGTLLILVSQSMHVVQYYFIRNTVPFTEPLTFMVNGYTCKGGHCCVVLGFNDTSTLVGHFVSSPREREKSDRRDSRRD